MSQDQIMGLLRQVLPILGGIAIARGWLMPASVASLTNTVLSVVGPVFVIAGVVWSLISNKQTSIAASIGANPNTVVTPSGGGTVTVSIADPAMAKAALDAQRAA
jgi:hypothetical protein